MLDSTFYEGIGTVEEADITVDWGNYQKLVVAAIVWVFNWFCVDKLRRTGKQTAK